MIVVTGATGFLGRAVIARVAADASCPVRGTVRRPATIPVAGVELTSVGELGPETDWSAALAGAEVVVHTAARVHQMSDTAADPLEEYRRVNVAGTLNLARQAAAAGVRRLVFISSIKVNGEGTQPGKPYHPDDPPHPGDPYGISKAEAEAALLALGRTTSLEIVIIRPVLVYGPGVKANMRAMMQWLRRGLPLPLGAIHNRRSLVALDNLVDLILVCATHPAAANQVFLVSDGEDLSTTSLLRRMAAALGVSSRLLPVPASWLRLAARLVGKGDVAIRLCGSLQVDITKTRRLLGWTPPVAVDEALARTARHFLTASLERSDRNLA